MIIVVFALLSISLVVLSFRIEKSEKAVTLWANSTSDIIVKDIRVYNKTCARLLKGYAVILFLIGCLISTKHTACIIAGYLLIVFASLILMILYASIESKHRTK